MSQVSHVPSNSQKPTRLQKFASLEWYDLLIEFVFKFTAKSSELLLTLGITYSAANVLSGGTLFESNSPFIPIWAWTQAIAVESSGGIVLVYALQSFKEQDKIKGIIYLVLATLLSFVGGIMLFAQLLASSAGINEVGLAHSVAWYSIAMSILRALVSIGYVVMCRTKKIRFSGFSKEIEINQSTTEQTAIPQSVQEPAITIESVRQIIKEVVTEVVTVTLIETKQTAILSPTTEQKAIEATASKKQVEAPKTVQEGVTTNLEKVRGYLTSNPNATQREVAQAVGITQPTAGKWMKKVKAEA